MCVEINTADSWWEAQVGINLRIGYRDGVNNCVHHTMPEDATSLSLST